MWKKTELKRAIDFFIQGEFYCSRQPTTQLYDYDSIKHLALGTNVDGRTDEFSFIIQILLTLLKS
ncbi:hypothetical protein [Lederbergia citrea]|uniref:Uncharacterized protein n=1 Tax=Lederbergia citrea TaxID=2833581 RepID=A0A942Z2W8_9BACI|nr:hypothetical protein [Lederbergia citrea]MBS4203418.1 hypothetical protein [Lederbergia citrea]MBS4221909.1 hypothetical protein [Lederbergia citrea]